MKTTLVLAAVAMTVLVGFASPATSCIQPLCSPPRVVLSATTFVTKVSLVPLGPPVGYTGLVHVEFAGGEGADVVGYGARSSCDIWNSLRDGTDPSIVTGCSPILAQVPVYGVDTNAGTGICLYRAFLGIDITHQSPDGYDYHTDDAATLKVCPDIL